jgi:hypothetical protein
MAASRSPGDGEPGWTALRTALALRPKVNPSHGGSAVLVRSNQRRMVTWSRGASAPLVWWKKPLPSLNACSRELTKADEVVQDPDAADAATHTLPSRELAEGSRARFPYFVGERTVSRGNKITLELPKGGVIRLGPPLSFGYLGRGEWLVPPRGMPGGQRASRRWWPPDDGCLAHTS